MKNRIETDINFGLNVNTRNRIYKALGCLSKSCSTKYILGIDIDSYRKPTDYQTTPVINWTKSESDFV